MLPVWPRRWLRFKQPNAAADQSGAGRCDTIASARASHFSARVINAARAALSVTREASSRYLLACSIRAIASDTGKLSHTAPDNEGLAAGIRRPSYTAGLSRADAGNREIDTLIACRHKLRVEPQAAVTTQLSLRAIRVIAGRSADRGRLVICQATWFWFARR